MSREAKKNAVLRDDVVRRLNTAYRRNDLTLYVGAGASVASSLPNWNGLLGGMFINSLQSIGDSGEMPLLQAVAETWFARSAVPLDVLARELRASFSPDDFMKWLRFSLYKWIDFKPSGKPSRRFMASLRENVTLSAIARLCRQTRVGQRGLRCVISYNFDDLLELRLGSYPHESRWMTQSQRPDALPIYHVHGFLPARFPWTPYREGSASLPDQIVLTEDQYHRQASDPYAWSNLIQLQALSDSVGLAVGLSMSDPNLRRLLDISRASSVRPEIYALLPPPDSSAVSDRDLDDVVTRAGELLQRGHPWLGNAVDRKVTKTSVVSKRSKAIWQRLDALATKRQVATMNELGVHPVWCEHAEIPTIVERVIAN